MKDPKNYARFMKNIGEKQRELLAKNGWQVSEDGIYKAPKLQGGPIITSSLPVGMTLSTSGAMSFSVDEKLASVSIQEVSPEEAENFSIEDGKLVIADITKLRAPYVYAITLFDVQGHPVVCSLTTEWGQGSVHIVDWKVL